MAGPLTILFAASLLALYGSSAYCEDDVPEVGGRDNTKLEKRVAVLEFQLRQLLGGNSMQSRRSCSDWLADGFLTSRHYIVDPDGLRGVPEFQVWCDMSVSPPIAVFHHDQEDRTLIHGFEQPGLYHHGQEVKSYWPGGNSQVGGCACYKTKSCSGGKKCNCNLNDNNWREDSGDVTDKEALPVTGFRLGDSGDDVEKAYITIGPLKCQN